MLGSISPVGEASRKQRWWLTVGAYTAGSLAGGVLVGSLLGAVGRGVTRGLALSSGQRLLGLATAVVLAVAADARLLGWRPPEWRRQVDERWLTTYRGWVYGAGFGLQLGTGVATIVPSAVTYAALTGAFLSGSWTSGLVVGATFGLVRSVPLLLTARLQTADQLYAAVRRVVAAEFRARRLTFAGQLAVAVVALAAAGTGGPWP